MSEMSAATETSIIIRDIDAAAEMRAVEELQKEVWKMPDLDVVPLTQLVAAKAAGGVLLGAFDGENLAGFAYGFASFENGRTAHHSHMLAVKPEYRNLNLGARLKQAQRECVLNQGLTEMSWTFDPMQSLNAYFNFNKLGVISDLYLINFYGGGAASFLHRSGTDRLWVTWHLDGERGKERTEKKVSAGEFETVKRLVKLTENNSPGVVNPAENLIDERVAIEIPADINELQKQNIERAVEWREATRAAFTAALEQGYVVQDFYRGKRGNQNYGAYLLERKKKTL